MSIARACIILVIIIASLLVFANVMNDVFDKAKTKVSERSKQWNKYAIEHNCSINESYFNVIEKWACDDGEIHWR